MKQLPPRMVSEISGRLTALHPTIREAFALDEITMSGPDFEKLACVIWMVGYGEGIADIAELGGPMPDVDPLLRAWGIENELA